MPCRREANLARAGEPILDACHFNDHSPGIGPEPANPFQGRAHHSRPPIQGRKTGPRADPAGERQTPIEPGKFGPGFEFDGLGGEGFRELILISSLDGQVLKPPADGGRKVDPFRFGPAAGHDLAARAPNPEWPADPREQRANGGGPARPMRSRCHKRSDGNHPLEGAVQGLPQERAQTRHHRKAAQHRYPGGASCLVEGMGAPNEITILSQIQVIHAAGDRRLKNIERLAFIRSCAVDDDGGSRQERFNGSELVEIGADETHPLAEGALGRKAPSGHDNFCVGSLDQLIDQDLPEEAEPAIDDHFFWRWGHSMSLDYQDEPLKDEHAIYRASKGDEDNPW